MNTFFVKYISYPHSISTINYALCRQQLFNIEWWTNIKISLLALFWRLVNINIYLVNICVYRKERVLPFIQNRMGLPSDLPWQGFLTQFFLFLFHRLVSLNKKYITVRFSKAYKSLFKSRAQQTCRFLLLVISNQA